MSSIYDGIDGTSIANQIRLERADYVGSFLLVEGDSDSNLFERFCDKNTCSIVICLGQENLLRALSELELGGFCGVLGFADRDFSKFLSYPDFRGTVVFSDENDVEIMILCSTALDNILREFGDRASIATITKSENKEVCELIFEAASFIGTLRLISQKEDWSLSFKGMKYKFKPNNSYLLDEIKTIKHIVGRSCVRPSLSEDKILARVKEFLSKCNERKNLCSGHDCMRILGKALKSKLGSENQFDNENGAKTLERILRLAYDYDNFRKTRAYRKIRKWEKRSGYKTLV